MRKPRHYCRDVLIRASLTISAVLTSLGAALAQTPIALDADGVQMLRPSATGGSNLQLGSNNPNRHPAFGFDYKAMASAFAAWCAAHKPFVGASRPFVTGNNQLQRIGL